MRVLHLASADRWTGAAAPAFFEVAALRAAGIEAFYGFVRGYTLQQRIAPVPWALPLIARRQDPVSFVRSAWALRAVVRERQIDVVHSHLTHDHALALWAVRGSKARVIRTFHATRAIRDDLVSRRTLARTSAVCAINASFLRNPAIAPREPVFTPPPVDHALFSPGDQPIRAERGIAPDATVVGFIGKMVPGRGFDIAISAFAALAGRDPSMRLLVVAKWGPHRDELDSLASRLGVADRIHWAGYQDDALTAHFRAMDLLLFTAPGSDEGHRAILEAMACGVAVASYPLAGIRALAGPLADRIVSPECSVESLVATAAAALERDRRALSAECRERTLEFGFEPSAQRLLEVYGRAQKR